MKIVIAIDSLKGSLTSIEAGNAIKEGILRVSPGEDIVIRPLADGGEGTTVALVEGMGGELKTIEVVGPVQSKVKAHYGIIKSQDLAVIEMAEAAGLPLVPEGSRNPLYTTTYGVGEMIRACTEDGVRKFIIGIGGSATNDAGIGMLMALGYKFFDANGKEVEQGGVGLSQIARVDDTDRLKVLDECTFKIACDVNNPLYGENGAAYIYAPQKGATPEIVKQLDEGLRSFAKVVATYKGSDYAINPGAGAAGGLGFAFEAFLKGKLESGIDIIMEETKLEDSIKEAQLVFTGEGRIDEQTAMGKGPMGVAKLAKKYNIPAIGVAGCIGKGAEKCNDKGMDAYFAIVNRSMSLEEAISREVALTNMTNTSEQIFRLIKAIQV